MNNQSITFSNKQLRKLIIPLIIEQFLAITVGLADSVMVASVGEAAVSAVSLVDTINTLIIYAFIALATGGAIVCGQLLGCKNLKKASQSAEQLMVFVPLIAVGILAILYIAKNLILRGLFGDVEADVMGYANTYYVIVEASIPFLAIYSCGAALFRTMENSMVSMKISIFMNIINVGGNAFMIFVLHSGVEGVAIPTLVSRIFGAAAIFICLRRDKYPIHLSKPFRPKLDKPIIKNILKLGIPNGVESSLFHLGKVLLLSVVSSLGTASIAANAIGNMVCNFQILPGQAIGTAMITVVSQCVGAKDFENVHFYTKKLMKWTYVSMIIANVIVFLLQPLIIKIYGVSPEASHMANIILWMHGGIGLILWPLSFVFPQVLKAAGDTTFTMFVGIGSMWLFRIAAGVIFSKYLGFGVLGIWMAMFIDWTFRITAFLIRYKRGTWKEKYIR